MLKDSLYIIHKITAENNRIEAVVELKEEHEIFKGHFPSQPVLPGACMLQMIKEISEAGLSVKLQLIKADDIKFLQMIVPESNTVLLFSIQCNFKESLLINVSAKIVKADVICCKLKALYQVKT
jgi:3-hydroxyacyl-[acyl-carrier-protein] dehydratase